MKNLVHETAEVLGLIGDGTKVWHQAQIREGAKVGRDCHIGKGVYIDKNVVIGDRCKIQNYACIYDGCIIGDDVFIGQHVTFTNDRYPRAYISDYKKETTIVEDKVSIGAGSVVMCGITIGKKSMVGAGSVVVNDVNEKVICAGNPAKEIGKVRE